MTRTDTWRRLAVETAAGATLLFDPADVFYLEADEHDTLVRTARAGQRAPPVRPRRSRPP